MFRWQEHYFCVTYSVSSAVSFGGEHRESKDIVGKDATATLRRTGYEHAFTT